MFPTIQPFDSRVKPVRILYVYSVIIVTIFVMAILWFIFSSIMTEVASAGMAVSNQVGSGGATYNQVNTFMTNLFTYFLAIMLLGLGYWTYIYAQRRGSPYE